MEKERLSRNTVKILHAWLELEKMKSCLNPNRIRWRGASRAAAPTTMGNLKRGRGAGVGLGRSSSRADRRHGGRGVSLSLSLARARSRGAQSISVPSLSPSLTLPVFVTRSTDVSLCFVTRSGPGMRFRGRLGVRRDAPGLLRRERGGRVRRRSWFRLRGGSGTRIVVHTRGERLRGGQEAEQNRGRDQADPDPAAATGQVLVRPCICPPPNSVLYT